LQLYPFQKCSTTKKERKEMESQKLFSVTIKGRMVAVTPMVQVASKEGNVGLFRRVPVVVKVGEKRVVKYIPCPSGNTLRSIIRVGIATDLMEAANEQKDYDTLIRLFQGGAGAAKVKPAGKGSRDSGVAEGIRKAEELKKADVNLALLGASLSDGTFVKGKVIVGEPLLLCKETANSDAFPPEYSVEQYEDMSAEGMITRIQFVRHDTFKDPESLANLSEEGFVQLMAADDSASEATSLRKRRKDSKKEGGGSVSEEVEGDTTSTKRQMIYSVEALARGAELYSYLIVKNPTDVELGAIVGAFRRFAKVPYIAAMSAKGMGAISLEYRAADSNGQDYGTLLIDGRGAFNVEGILAECLRAYDKYLGDIRDRKISL
jgi:hypothetical protein